MNTIDIIRLSVNHLLSDLDKLRILRSDDIIIDLDVDTLLKSIDDFRKELDHLFEKQTKRDIHYQDPHIIDLVSKVETLQKEYKQILRQKYSAMQEDPIRPDDFYVRVNSEGIIKMFFNDASQACFVFKWNQLNKKFQKLRIFHGSSLGRCNTYHNEWNPLYWAIKNDNQTQPKDIKQLETTEFYMSDEIINLIRSMEIIR